MKHPALQAGATAVVTGAGQGIGRAIAERLSALGLRVALLDIGAENLRDAREAMVGDSQAILCDVAEVEALDHACARITETWGQVPTVLVNNAVTRIGRGLWDPLQEWRRALDINVMGVVNGVRAFVPGMRASGEPGLVVNVGSKQGITNPPGHPVYNMAKAAVKSFTESLAHDLRQDTDNRITAHLLVPGWTSLDPTKTAKGAWTPQQVTDFMLSALGRGDFYIVCPDGEVSEAKDKARILWGAEDIVENRPALSRWHPDWSETFQRKEPK